MNAQHLHNQLNTALARLSALQSRAERLSARNRPAVLDSSLAQLQNALEELRVANEELRHQAEELQASRASVLQERERYQRLFGILPDACVLTDASGRILEGNRAASTLLNVSGRFLPERSMFLFVGGGREAVEEAVRRLLAGEDDNGVSLSLVIRPREKAPVRMSVHVALLAVTGEPRHLCWMLRPEAGRD